MAGKKDKSWCLEVARRDARRNAPVTIPVYKKKPRYDPETMRELHVFKSQAEVTEYLDGMAKVAAEVFHEDVANRVLLTKVYVLAANGQGFARSFGGSVLGQATRYYRRHKKPLTVSPKQAVWVDKLFEEVLATLPAETPYEERTKLAKCARCAQHVELHIDDSLEGGWCVACHHGQGR